MYTLQQCTDSVQDAVTLTVCYAKQMKCVEQVDVAATFSTLQKRTRLRHAKHPTHDNQLLIN